MTSLQRRYRAEQINHLNDDDKSMHIFYTLEEIEQFVAQLHKTMDINDPTLGQKIAELEDISSTLDRMIQRCELAQTFLANA
jgi:ABC-type transporter Mla subunit MlaD